MNDDDRTPEPMLLDCCLQATAADLGRQAPSAEQAAATLAAMQQAFAAGQHATLPTRSEKHRLRWRTLFVGAGAAACVAILLGAGLLLALPPSLDTTLSAQAGVPSSDFVPLVSSDRWAGYLRDSGGATKSGAAWLVPTEIPSERLALLGLPYDPARAGERVRAELLMHESGDVLAVRIIR